ncbi:MAG: hypothetical protein A2527_03435 [Candidatus Lambdaproteobacteria bacterium RIFOXYD2_FULL_50_16]|uniref:NAD-dependent epimerase/dehydratase domain-containing protein n=1 Tax=Candidatus Lambdaproteobacteria bacterium RIFOXYD2_FULL_50_16 TaxID=1817772 RepID=A0A1F6GET3_9PROT|nr:MAG: hypothetical protein A2527_03435 [Candidatus Lambdaproteobacteria bacterium RIFOXYD2_FULL_50_16]
MKKLFITGATGFLGHNFIDQLVGQPYELYLGIHQHRPELVRELAATLVPYEELDQLKLGPDFSVVHFAARAHQMRDNAQNPALEFQKANRDFTLNLAQKAKDAGVEHFIFISSVKVMGDRPGYYNLASPTHPSEPYGVSKWEAEQGLEEIFGENSKTRVTIVRLPLVYGPEVKGNVLSLLSAARQGLTLPLRGASGARSMLYVGNLVDALLKVLQSEEPKGLKRYFLTDCDDLTSSEFYSLIFQCFFKGDGVVWFPEPLFRAIGHFGGLVQFLTRIRMPINPAVVSRLFDEFRFDGEAFRKDYHWTPPFSPKEGVTAMVRWYMHHSDYDF